MNGGWFWWCPKQGQQWLSSEDFQKLWRFTYHYFTTERKLDNLLWVYSAAVQFDSEQQSAVHYYPGNPFADVVGLDWYTDRPHGEALKSYQELVGLGRPIGLTEFGPATRRDGSFDVAPVIPTLRQHYPQLSFTLFWHNWPGAKMALIEQTGAEEFLRDESVLSRKK
jgi:mannan endo-1,4-beta-mannosidase